ncbi:AAA family ATPase [Pelagicoccus sp. SDUM812005]|uniref:AAA family ATPase n=1 Tax=Pelagicoccus sp. SDUM812005 TaxID=3041257 RepID=UPI00280C43C9|nr:AAA family ATPase [Pelagicoccus sp. SDUM812005]MDQ8183796.1 AAA family ATPase [Pelagicoccus sp. SDUM812005]
MKQARASDYWRRCYRTTPSTELISISFDNVPVLGTVAILLGKGVSAITGLNGSGKSTVLHAIWLCSTDSASNSEMALDTRLTEGTATLKLRIGEAMHEIVYDFSTQERRLIGENEGSDLPDLDVKLVSTSEIIPKFQNLIRRQTNLSDLIEQVDSYTFDEKELGLVRYITGKSYDSIDVFEVELGLETNWPELPYFRVSKGSQSYGVEHLGLGELACLFLFWVTKRMKSDSILLMDEPESFLAAHSQGAVADLIAFLASERNVACVLTSHSNDTVCKVPYSRRLITMMSASGLCTTTAEESPNHLSALGIGKGTKIIAATEDAAACSFLRELLIIGAPVLRSSVEVIWAGSSGQVVALLNSLPEELRQVRVVFVGILDGDQRTENHKCNLPLLYLPVVEDPEEVAQATATKHLPDVAQALGTRVETFQAALAKAEGTNFHDWPFTVANELGRGHFDILSICFRVFITNDLDPNILEKFLAEFTSIK